MAGPLPHGGPDWQPAVIQAALGNPVTQRALLDIVGALARPGTHPHAPEPARPRGSNAAWQRLLDACPCLYGQFQLKAPAKAIVHLAEVSTARGMIDDQNMDEVFGAQHPTHPSFRVAPYARSRASTASGDISEMIVKNGLLAAGIDEVGLVDGWPAFDRPGLIDLNQSSLKAFKNYGDLLITTLPSNLLVSVKTQAARERLLASGTRDVVGVGFFNEPGEFDSPNRAINYRERGFLAIYMPTGTLAALSLAAREEVNLLGSPLYRDLHRLATDMRRVLGRSVRDL